MTAHLQPPAPFFGGKQRIADQIADLLPEHRHYVEPFCGGLSVLLAKPPADLETINDPDADLVTFWRMLRDRPTDLTRLCEFSAMPRLGAAPIPITTVSASTVVPSPSWTPVA